MSTYENTTSFVISDHLTAPILEAFRNLEIEKAEINLNQLQTQNQLQERWKYHHLGKVALVRKQDLQALDYFHKALKIGPHVGLLCDLAFIYYQMGAVDHFKQSVIRLERELASCETLLSEENFLKTMTALMKFKEELGCVAESFAIGDRIINYCMGKPERQNELKKTKIQLLRMAPYFDQKKIVSALYFDCINTDYPLDLKVELEHGLMLCELSFMSIESGLFRLRRMMASEQITETDKALLLYDAIEACLWNKDFEKWKKQAWLLERIESHKPNDLFEKEVRNIFLDQKSSINSFEVLIEWQNQLTPMTYLRLLSLVLKRGRLSTALHSDLRKHCLMLVESLPLESRSLIVKKLNSLSSEHQLEENILIELDMATRQLIFNDQKVSWADKDNHMKLLTMFTQKEEFSVVEICEVFYDQIYSEALYNRFRIFVQRANKELSKTLGLPTLLTLKNKKYKLNKLIRINRINELN